jgi:hypothetical protein
MWIGYETGGDIKDNAEAEMRLKDLFTKDLENEKW